MNGKLGEGWRDGGSEGGREVGIGERRRWGEGREIFIEKLNWRRIAERRQETTDAVVEEVGGEKREKKGDNRQTATHDVSNPPSLLHPSIPLLLLWRPGSNERSRVDEPPAAPLARFISRSAVVSSPHSLRPSILHPSLRPPAVPSIPFCLHRSSATSLRPLHPSRPPPSASFHVATHYRAAPSLPLSLPPSVRPSISPFTWCWPSPPPRVSARAGRRRGRGAFQMDRL